MNTADTIYKLFKYGAVYARDPIKEARRIKSLANNLVPSEYSFSIPATFITEPILLTTTHKNVFGKVPHVISVYLSPDRIKTVSAHLNINAYKKKPEITSYISATVDRQNYKWNVPLYGVMYWIKQIHKQLGFADNPTVGVYARSVYSFLEANGNIVGDQLENIDADRVHDEIFVAPHSYLVKQETRKRLWTSAVNYTNIGELCAQVMDGDMYVLKKRVIRKKKEVKEFRDNMKFRVANVSLEERG